MSWLQLVQLGILDKLEQKEYLKQLGILEYLKQLQYLEQPPPTSPPTKYKLPTNSETLAKQIKK